MPRNDPHDDTQEPFDSQGMYRDQREWPHLDGPGPIPKDYVERKLLHEACDLMRMLLIASGNSLAMCYRDQASAFIKRHGRPIATPGQESPIR